MKNFTLSLIAAILILSAAPMAHAQTAVTVTVDYSTHTAASNQIASGFIHGVGPAAPYQYLVDGVKVNQIRGMAYYNGEIAGVNSATEPGQYQPNFFDPATYARASATGTKLLLGLYYYVDATGNTYWPGDDGNQTTWRNTVAGLYNYSVANHITVYSWLPWNEPNLQWNGALSPDGVSTRNTAAFDQAWLNAYQEMKGLNPAVKIQGPEISDFDSDYLETFLSFCKTNNCLPDILSWHELNSSAPENIESDTATIKAWMTANGITPMPLAVSEYAGGKYSDPISYSPGQLAAYIAKLERSSVASQLQFAVKSCWDYSSSNSAFFATVADQADAATGSYPTAGWWVYNAYKDATGQVVSETSSNTADTDAFAAYDLNMWRSVILLGDPVGGTSSNITLTLKNLNDASSLLNGTTTHVRVVTLNPTSTLYQPTVALEGDFIATGNAVTLTLPTLASQSAYRILVNSAIATAPTTFYEAHLLPVTYTGASYTVYAGTGSRDGTATALNATAIGQEVTYTISVPTAGVYDLRAGLKSGSSHGMMQLYVNGAAVGGPKDQYAAGIAFYSDDYGNVSLPAGNSTLEFVAVNKEPSSTDYTMAFDYFELITLERN